MQSVFQQYGNWSWLLVLLVHFVRYTLIAGIAFSIWYVWKRPERMLRKIQPRLPKLSDYQREVLYSFGTAVVFMLVTLLIYQTGFKKYTLGYRNWSDYGTAYGIFSFVALVFFHDAYFYWTHRAMHHPKLFKIMHLVHHKSTNPSPWAAYAFHPLEAIVEAGVIPLAILFIPLHIYTIMAFLLFMIVYNVYGHLGWELFPAHSNRHPVLRWFNTSVSHNQHHQFFTGNYGLYFRFWDEWMHTTRADYDRQFDRITEKNIGYSTNAGNQNTASPIQR